MVHRAGEAMLRSAAAMAKSRRRFNGQVMRTETEKVVEEIKRSVGLLRRHL